MVTSDTIQVRLAGAEAPICGKPAADDTVDSAEVVQPLAPVAVAVKVPALVTVTQLPAMGEPLIFQLTVDVGATVAQISAELMAQVNSALVTAIEGVVTSSVTSTDEVEVQPLEVSVTNKL